MASLLADEYRKVDAGTDNPQDKEKTRLRLLYELNSTGKYHAIKEQLKKSIIQGMQSRHYCTTCSPWRYSENHFFIFHLPGTHCSTSRAREISAYRINCWLRAAPFVSKPTVCLSWWPHAQESSQELLLRPHGTSYAITHNCRSAAGFIYLFNKS